MSQSPGFSEWYTRPQSATRSWSNNVAEEAFESAKAKFASDLTKDSRRIAFVHSTSTLEDVRIVVQNAMEKYNASRSENESQKWLVKLSQRIHYYSGVLDVFAQHHPEYVALAWGSIKFLLMAVLNHETVITTLAKAIAEIAWNLPRVQLHSLLYPTDRMKEAVTNLYACILKFLIRARGWYEQGKLHRFIHSITRPVELRYQDLLDEITSNSLIVEKLAHSGLQAEIRDMHQKFTESQAETRDISLKLADSLAENKDMSRKMEAMYTLIKGIQITMNAQSVVSVNTNYRVTDVQYKLSMAALLNIPALEPQKSYQYHNALKRQRALGANIYAVPDSFWRSEMLQAWSSTSNSAVSVIAGGFQARFALRDLCVGIIGQLYEAKVPVLFALKVLQTNDDSTEKICTIDILKSLSHQVMDIQQELQTEKTMAVGRAKFHEAVTEQDWFRVLEALLAGIRGQVYIIVDLGLLLNEPSLSEGFSWTKAFNRFFKDLSQRNSSTKIKVLLVSYGTLPFRLTTEERSTLVVSLKTQLVTARQRKAGRAPRMQQQGFRLKGMQGVPLRDKLRRL